MRIFSYNDSCNSVASFYPKTLHFHENYINLLCTNVLFIQCTSASTTWKLMFEWQQNKQRKLAFTISYMHFEDVLCMYDKKKLHKYLNGEDMKNKQCTFKQYFDCFKKHVKCCKIDICR